MKLWFAAGQKKKQHPDQGKCHIAKIVWKTMTKKFSSEKNVARSSTPNLEQVVIHESAACNTCILSMAENQFYISRLWGEAEISTTHTDTRRQSHPLAFGEIPSFATFNAIFRSRKRVQFIKVRKQIPNFSSTFFCAPVEVLVTSRGEKMMTTQEDTSECREFKAKAYTALIVPNELHKVEFKVMED